MYVLIDNYDSFTYNVYQYLSELTDQEIRVFRNDRVSIEEIRELQPAAIIISPGPGRPEEAGISVEVIREFHTTTPILGICLGHQAIGYAFGAKIVQAKNIVHGKTDSIRIDNRGLFRTIPSPATFTRYHSLVIEEAGCPPELEISAWSSDGEIMGVRHREFAVEGVQFHPESVASDFGRELLRNFLNYRREPLPHRELLSKALRRENLSSDEAASFMRELTEGNLTHSQIAAYLTALNAKGIVPEEIAGCVAVLHEKRTPFRTSRAVLDTCGTGGDGLGTFNISSMTALVAAACGVSVAKHGNKAVSSLSGSADFYRELGIAVDMSPDKAERLLDDTGFAFLYAPLYHGAMKYAAPVRRDLGIKTIMNLLGPLANPAGASYQLIGVYSPELCEPVARAAHLLGIKRVMVVHGADGLDEISVTGPTRVVTVDESGALSDRSMTLEENGVRRFAIEDLRGGSPEANAATARELLAGLGPPAVREAVLINSAAALLVSGAVDSMRGGYERAAAALDTGLVKEKLDEIVRRSNELAAEGVPA